MGNSVSFIKLHTRRLINRYNAQYRAHKYIEKEKLPSAPRHSLPPQYSNIKTGEISVEDFQIKDQKLCENLKDVYIRSHVEVLKKAKKIRPLPLNAEEKENVVFSEPVIEKGFCTLEQACTFLASYNENPTENNSKTIAEKYSLDEKKVENILKYFAVFKVFTQIHYLKDVPKPSAKEFAIELEKSYKKHLENKMKMDGKSEDPEKSLSPEAIDKEETVKESENKK